MQDGLTNTIIIGIPLTAKDMLAMLLQQQVSMASPKPMPRGLLEKAFPSAAITRDRITLALPMHAHRTTFQHVHLGTKDCTNRKPPAPTHANVLHDVAISSRGTLAQKRANSMRSVEWET